MRTKTFLLVHRKFLPFSLLMALAAWSVDARALTADDLAGVWTGNAVLTACGAGCGSPIGLTYASDLSITPTGSNSFDGAFIWGAVGTGTLVVTSVNFSFTYTYATSWGNCSGTVDGNSMTMSCDHYLGDGRFNGRTAVYLTHTIRPGPSPTPSANPSLSLSDVHVTQAVPDFKFSGGPADLDLVKGKNTVVESVVHASDFSQQSGLVTVSAQFDNGPAIQQSVALSEASNPSGAKIRLLSLQPAGGESQLKIWAQSGLVSINVSKSVRVKETNPLGVVYTSLNAPIYSRVRVEDFSAHKTNSDNFLQGIMPVGEGEIISQVAENISGSNASSDTLRALADIPKIALARTLTNANARNGIGIVAPEYFSTNSNGDVARGISFSYPSEIGLSVFSINASIVTSGYWSTTAHEIGHTFGLNDNDLPNTFSAFWGNLNLLFPVAFNLMGPESSREFETFQHVWVNPDEYSRFFSGLLLDQHDPEVFVISGSISKTGKVTFQPSYFLRQGLITPSDTSINGKVVVRDVSGVEIASSSFASSYTLVSDRGVQTDVDESPFLVQVPATDALDTVEIYRDGKSLGKIEPKSQLLSNAIRAIPDTSFLKNAYKTRLELLNDALIFEAFVKACKRVPDTKRGRRIEEICERLAFDRLIGLRKDLEMKVTDSALKNSPTDMTLVDVLGVIDVTGLYILPDHLIRSHHHASTIRLIPNSAFRKQSPPIYQIISVSQGQFGRVTVNANGTVTYRPARDTPKEDSFQVVIQDLEGTRATKSVSISPIGMKCAFMHDF